MKIQIITKLQQIIYFTIASISLSSCSKETDSNARQNINSSRPSVPILAPKVQIGNQIWMTKNLNVAKYRNGDIIPEVQNPTQWANLTTGAWCYYENNSANGIIYGRLYNYYAVNDSRGITPIGYRVPTRDEMIALNNFLGGENVSGGKLKALNMWNAPNVGATNSTGFTALPAGVRNWAGTFSNLGNKCFFWTSDWGYELATAGSVMTNNETSNIVGMNNKKNAFSIRCIKN